MSYRPFLLQKALPSLFNSGQQQDTFQFMNFMFEQLGDGSKRRVADPTAVDMVAGEDGANGASEDAGGERKDGRTDGLVPLNADIAEACKAEHTDVVERHFGGKKIEMKR
jgi:hypothetical protein